MPKGIVISLFESEPIYLREFHQVQDYQDAVEGYFQVIDFEDVPATLFCDEEGKVKQLPLNRRATLLLWLHHPAYRGHDAIFGPAVLLGQPDKEGDTTDVPSDLEALLLNTERYRFDVQTVDDPNAWNSNKRPYEDWEDAYNAAVGLSMRWTAVERIRVVPL